MNESQEQEGEGGDDYYVDDDTETEVVEQRGQDQAQAQNQEEDDGWELRVALQGAAQTLVLLPLPRRARTPRGNTDQLRRSPHATT